MKPFLDKDFLLQTETSKELFHEHASKMPIIDYHCHVSPKEIAEDASFENITQAWLSGDHYKWRLMRANGVPEEYITGRECADYEKFEYYAKSLPRAIGNPLYHWTHLELARYFDCDIPLTADTAKAVWDACDKKIKSERMSVRKIIKMSNVKAVCTTDDPADTLEWHKAMLDDKSWDVKVLPTFRAERAMNIHKPDFKEYIEILSNVVGHPVKTLDDMQAALTSRMDLFDEVGCVISDHSLDCFTWTDDHAEKSGSAFEKALAGEMLSECEIAAYRSAMLLFLGREYTKRDWAMQIHYGVIRNTNTAMLGKIGLDAGFDCISTQESSAAIISLLNALNAKGNLPKTILYSLNPNDDAFLACAAGCFQESGIAGKIQHGSAWWFNDTKPGMEAQMTRLASIGVLGNFVGMLTDSRSFLSYTRHEYFRRILCNLVGKWVENGEYPCDKNALGKLIEDISYNNAKKYFKWQL